MSVENRSNSALFKRAEQLKRWEESETNREIINSKTKSKRIQFSLECVFLAACASSDKEEVLRLLNIGADIDTSNVDGLSALHQACIDDNLDMVEFLVEHGADINKGDNEGWTPLHATASCGFISIAKYLIEHGADVASVNNDGELAVDIAESDEMEDLLHTVLKEKGIDSDEARNKEERIMLQHAKEWLKSGKFEDIPHEKTGATALHVAASKGYIKVMDTLIQAGADVNAQDFDGWTPLHAAAHWGQKEACEILVENFCDMDKKNYVGQTAFDVSEGEIVRLLEDLRKKQSSLQKEKTDINIMANINKRAHSPKRRLINSDKLLKDKDSTLDRQPLSHLIMEEVVSPMDKVPKVELKLETELETRTKTNITDENKKNLYLNNEEKQKIPRLPDTTTNKVPINSVPSTSPPKSVNENEDDVRVPSWRKPVSLRNVIRPPFKFEEENKWTASNDQVNLNSDDKIPEVVLRRTQSFEADDKFYRRYCELKAKIESGNARPALIPPANNTANLPMRSASLKEKYRKGLMHEDVLSSSTLTQTSTNSATSTAVSPDTTTVTTVPNSISVRNGVKNTVNTAEATTVSAPTTPIASKLSPGNIFKNFFKSFVPPVRDEESETQRKAHAKRVRETRRSTQGVTLEEFKSAEQLVKKKQQQQQLQQVTSQLNSPSPIVEQSKSTDLRKLSSSDEPANMSVSATIHTGTTTVPLSNKNANERRPSWRLKIDNGCKFMLEDARNNEKDAESPSDAPSSGWPGSQTISELPDTANVTLPLRKNNNLFSEELDQTKSDNDKNLAITQPVNPRRKRPKRRSTGAVQFDVEELYERLNSEGEVNDIGIESGGTDKSGPTSRLGSTSSLGDNDFSSRPTTPGLPNENGVLDYKKLYEEMLLENERLRNKLKKTEEELTQCKSRATEPPPSAVNKNSLSELEKREKRAMERKLSEMEEELKTIEHVKQENQRLKDENGALIRVISKLSK